MVDENNVSSTTMSYNNGGNIYPPYGGGGRTGSQHSQQQQEDQSAQHPQSQYNIFYSGSPGGGRSGSFNEPLYFYDLMNTSPEELAQSLLGNPAPSGAAGGWALLQQNAGGNFYYNLNRASQSANGGYHLQMPSGSLSRAPLSQQQQQHYYFQAQQSQQPASHSSSIPSSRYYVPPVAAGSSSTSAPRNTSSERPYVSSGSASPPASLLYNKNYLQNEELDPIPANSSSASAVKTRPKSLDTIKSCVPPHSSLSSNVDPQNPLDQHEVSSSSEVIEPITSSCSVDNIVPPTPLPPEIHEETILIPDLSTEPFTAQQICDMIQGRAYDVTNRYLPCVDFLVTCQQDLRRGVEKHRRATGPQKLTTLQFYKSYFQPLSARFFRKFNGTIPQPHLANATQEITKLCDDARLAKHPELMKSNFLGGMREGQSWGLRRWLSNHGAALQVCNELEMILTALQKLDEGSPFCISLAAKVRRLTSGARERLLSDIPKAYQEFSSAHPFLPFFHRLDAALKHLSEFDPEDDDVILVDDDEIEELKEKAKQKDAEKAQAISATDTQSLTMNSIKRSLEQKSQPQGPDPQPQAKRMRPHDHFDSLPTAEKPKADDSSDDEIIVLESRPSSVQPGAGVSEEPRAGKSPSPAWMLQNLGGVSKTGTPVTGEEDWRCPLCILKNPFHAKLCLMCDQARPNIPNVSAAARPTDELDQFWDHIMNQSTNRNPANSNHQGVDTTATSSAKQNDETENDASNSEENDADDDEETEDADESDSSDLGKIGQNMAQTVERFQYSSSFGTPTMDFWDANWSFCTTLFATILRQKEAVWYLEPVNQEELELAGRPPYSSIVKNPLSFKCIISALKKSEKTKSDKDGKLKGTNLKFNVRHGRDLLQAIDVVFLNALAYNGKEWNEIRRDTLKLRRMFWERIKAHARDDPRQVPTRRGEASGFIVNRDAPSVASSIPAMARGNYTV